MVERLFQTWYKSLNSLAEELRQNMSRQCNNTVVRPNSKRVNDQLDAYLFILQLHEIRYETKPNQWRQKRFSPFYDISRITRTQLVMIFHDHQSEVNNHHE